MTNHNPTDAVAGFTAEITHDPAMPIPEGFDAAGRAYYVKITYAASGQSLTLPYYMGSACDEPTPLDVVMSLCRDASAGALDFDDFCADLGYSEDSRSAYATWEACQTYNGELRRITGDDSAAVWAELNVAQDATFAARCALADIALGARPVAHCTGGIVEIF